MSDIPIAGLLTALVAALVAMAISAARMAP